MSMGGITDFQELFNSLLSLTLCKLSNYCSSVLLVSYGIFTPTCVQQYKYFYSLLLSSFILSSLRMFFSSTCSVPPFYCGELCDMLLLIFFFILLLLWLGVLNKATAFPFSLPHQTALVP